MDAINAAAQIWFRYMTSAAVQATLLALLLLGIVWAGKRLSPAMRHALLMIALLKFVIPPTLPLPTGLFSQIRPEVSSQSTPAIRQVAPVVKDALWLSEDVPPVFVPAPAAKPGIVVRPLPAQASSMLSAEKHPLTTKAWLMMLHLFGVLLILALAVYQRFRLRKLAAVATPAEDPELLAIHDELCKSMKLLRRPRLLLSHTNHAPMTFGTWKPVIVLSQDLVAALPLSEIRVILGHELAHQRRWDLWLNWLQVAISAIWWFNPVYWLLAHKIRSVREDCCDDLVVSSELASGEGYCDTLLQAARIARGNALAGASLAYIGESQPLRRRFKRIMSAKIISKPRLAWTGILIVLLLALLFLPGVQKRVFHRGATQPATSNAMRPASAANQGPSARNGRLSPGSSVSGAESANHDIIITVLETASGRGIQGASVVCSSAIEPAANTVELITDKNGQCTVSVPPRGLVTARASGYVAHTKSFGSGNYPDEYAFKLEKGTTIGGFVRSEEEKPIPDVKLWVVYQQTESLPRPLPLGESIAGSTVTTDAAGRWTCNEVPSKPDAIVLNLTHPEYAPVRYTTDAVAFKTAYDPIPVQKIAQDELRAGNAILVMKYGVLVSGTVLDENGRAIEGATLTQIEGIIALAKATTVSGGRFSFASPKSGEIVLVAQAKSFAPARQDVTVAPKMPEVEFRLQKGAIVSGHVVDDDGKPVARVRIGTTGRGDEYYYPWQTMTDAAGKFLWDSAPATSLHYLVLPPEGFDSSNPFFLLEPGKDNEIKLHKLQSMHLTGTVVDAKTKKPLDKFKVLAMVGGSPVGPVSADGQNGGFTVTLQDRSYGSTNRSTYSIRIEAQGYRPDSSKSVDVKDGDQNLEFTLERGGGLAGTVRLPSGEPLAGAKVYLFGATTQNGIPFPAVMRTPGSLSYPTTFNQTVVTDESGKFSFDPMPEAHSVFVTHEKGFAALTPDIVTASPTITLQPWGRIEGTLRIGKNAGVDQNVLLSSLLPMTEAPAFGVVLRAASDNEGKFVFPMMPPGEYQVYTGGMVRGASTIVTVHAGETSNVTLGGMGCPVVGRFVVTGTEVPIDWRIYTGLISPSLDLKLPDAVIPDTRDPKYREWARSDEAQNRARAKRSYDLLVSPDGSFRAEDVLAGTYILTFTFRTATSMVQLTREIVVPEMPGGRSDTPLDLGTITFQAPAKK